MILCPIDFKVITAVLYRAMIMEQLVHAGRGEEVCAGDHRRLRHQRPEEDPRERPQP